MKKKKEEPSLREVASRGGKATLEKHGTVFFKEIGTLGGAALAAAYGKEHFSAMGKKGAETRRRIMAAGKIAMKKGRCGRG